MQGVKEQSQGLRMRARCTAAIELPQRVLLLLQCHPIAAAGVWCPRCAAYLVGRAAPLAEGLRAAESIRSMSAAICGQSISGGCHPRCVPKSVPGFRKQPPALRCTLT